MRKTLIIIVLYLISWSTSAQELPQFTNNSFDGWNYNNPGVQLNATTISDGRIVLYVNSKKKALMLTSPEFSCQDVDSIAADVLWYTSTFANSAFDLSRAALTMAIDDSQGVPLDSVTCVPTVTGSSRTLSLRIAVPQGLENCRLRFVSWSGDIISSGAIKRAEIYAVAATPHPDDVLLGDVDGDGEITIGDVTELIDCLLMGTSNDEQRIACDIDQDGKISIGDVTALIDIIIGKH